MNGDRRVARGHGGEVHRRRGDGGLRRARRCTRTTRCVPVARRSRCGTRCRSLASQARIGVNTGEVVTGTEERLATGDAVNVAARLEQAAAPGEVLDRRADALSSCATRSRRSRSSRSCSRARRSRCRPTVSSSLLHAPERSHRCALRRPGARARARPRELGAGALGGALRARHGRRRGRRGQVAPRGGGAGADRLLASSAAAAFPTARASPTGRWSRC